MATSPVLLWFGLAKTVTYGTCAAIALAHYLRRIHRARMPGQFGWFVAGLFQMTAGELLGYAWQSSLAPAPGVAAAGDAALLPGLGGGLSHFLGPARKARLPRLAFGSAASAWLPVRPLRLPMHAADDILALETSLEARRGNYGA